MKFKYFFIVFPLLISCKVQSPYAGNAVQLKPNSNERHLKNLTQLTFGGDNAEAYWSFNDKMLSFQSNNPAWGLQCDQIFFSSIKNLSDSNYIPKMVSTSNGRTTCSYFLPDNKSILFASTHKSAKECPIIPQSKGSYVWPVYASYDIFVADLNGKIINQLTNEDGYDAEATISPDGKTIVFTSSRSGDLELYTMNIDGTNVKQITTGLGYDGGAFFSPDGKKLVFRSSRPKTEEEISKYKELLSKGLVEPTNMEIYVCDINGENLKQVTNLGKANWAPYFLPDGKRIIFSSNHKSVKGYDFQLFMINEDGTGIEQITTESVFNAFPMFSHDGKKIVFSSNRNNGGTRATNIFVADWVD